MNLVPAKHKRRRRSLLRSELTPMIDVIFLLLIYFFVTNTAQPPESELAPALQAQRVAGGGAADFQPQIVDVQPVGGQPAFRVGARTMRTKDELGAVLESLPQDGGLFVRGHGAVSTEWVTAALQVARDSGFLAVTYVPGEDAQAGEIE